MGSTQWRLGCVVFMVRECFDGGGLRGILSVMRFHRGIRQVDGIQFDFDFDYELLA
jgi:hypothetical protein